MERRWLSLAHSYDFSERLSAFTRTVQKAQTTERSKVATAGAGTSGARRAFPKRSLWGCCVSSLRVPETPPLSIGALGRGSRL
jgi:hypothetical protein